jgi:hypothetical protein
MAFFHSNNSSKLILEQGDYIYEADDPSITLTMGHDCVTIEARCWNFVTKLKEEMETFVQETESKNEEPKESKKTKKIKARKDRFPKNGGRPIKASVPGYSKIPWSKSTLTLIMKTPDGQIHYAKTLEEKKNFAWSNFDWILVCWPGQYSQDIFLIDDVKEFRKALGFKPREESVVIDEDGQEWIDHGFLGKTTPTTTYTSSSNNKNIGYRGMNDWDF